MIKRLQESSDNRQELVHMCLKQFTKIINLIKSFYIFNKFNM